MLQAENQGTFLWMENANMSFSASQSTFINATVKGSKIHEWADEKLFSKVDAIRVEQGKTVDNTKVRELCLEFISKTFV